MSKASLSSKSIDEMNDNPFMEWISQNKQYILYGIIALFTLIILASRFIAARNLKEETDFFQAQTDFTRFQTSSMQINEAKASEYLAQLEPILERRPELQAKYDGLIAQNLLINQNVSQARPFAARTFKRLTNEPTGLYVDYATTSLLIGEGQYAQAAVQAQELKNIMDQASTENFGGTLYIYNLVRLALLYQQLNQVDQELHAWEDIQKYRGSSEALVAVQQLFQDGHTSLNQYIAERRKILNP